MNKTREKYLKHCCVVFYKMYKNGVLDELCTEEFMSMWEALFNFYGLYFEEQVIGDFMEEVNCLKSEDKKWFNDVFNKYFN